MGLVAMVQNSFRRVETGKSAKHSDSRIKELPFEIEKMLTSNHKEQRKRALKELLERLEDAEATDKTVKENFDSQNLHLTNILNDQVEACRDLAVDVLQRYFALLPPEERDLNYVIPTLFRRLGSQERVEEIRLKCVSLLKTIIARYQAYLPIYVDCLSQTLAQTLLDNYPLAKRESCECVCILARNLPRSSCSQLENLVKPVLATTSHRHYKIRVTGIRTIGELMMYISANSIEEVTSALAERLFDQNGLVRGAVIDVAGRWMTEYPHRYSYFHKILPLLLTGLHDSVKEVRHKSSELWDAAGKLYLEENQKDEKLKDRLDYLSEPPMHYPNTIRPNLGCRELAQLNFSKLINGIALELTDWMADIRVRSAQLLCVFVLHVEEHITQHIEKLLPPMYRACNDDIEGVVTNVEKAAEYMGYFVAPSLYCQLVLPTIEEAPSPGHLRVLSAILRGSDQSLLTPKLKELGNFLRQAQICQSKKANYQATILSCCKALLRVCQSDCTAISEHLYTIIFSALSMAENKSIKQEAEQLFNLLASLTECADPRELHDRHAKQMLDSFASCESWTIHTAEALIFACYLSTAVTVITTNGDAVLSILRTTLSTESEPELRLRYFILLSEYFSTTELPVSLETVDFIKSFIETCIHSNLVWTAGRSAEAIRISVICCLCAVLRRYQSLSRNIPPATDEGTKDSHQFLTTLRKILPVLISLMDDNATKTRLYSLEAIGLLMSIEGETQQDQHQTVHQVYPTVLKRLDDGCDDVRAQAMETLAKIWTFIPKDYDTEFNKGHVDSMYMTMIIHLDDSCPKFRELAHECLRSLARIHPELLHQKLQNSLPKFRNPDKIEELVQHCRTILRCNDS